MESLLPEPLAPYSGLIVGVAKALLIFAVGWIASKWANALGLAAFRKRGLDEAVSRFLAALLQYAVLAAALLAALDAVGIETTSLVAILGSAALAVGLALQGSLANFASGVMVLLFRPFTIGDVITAAGHTGKVDEIGLFATILITPENQKIIIPNAQATGGSIVNLTVLGTRRVGVEIGVAYGTEPEKVMQILIEAAKTVDLVLDDPEPAAALTSFGASSVNYTVFSWAKSEDWLAVTGGTRVAVYNALNAAGIEIPFDQVVMHQAG
jgi:small conductance mechanosensitive channel